MTYPEYAADLTADERQWADSAGRALRDSEQQLDLVTVARLRAARSRALATVAAERPVNWALPLALAAGVMTWTLLPRLAVSPLEEPGVAVARADVLEILTDERGPEFYEDLELYQWMEEQGDESA